jgi:hypothetical protein
VTSRREPLVDEWAPGALEDLEALDIADQAVAAAALAALDDVLHRRKTGKALGALYRVRFDADGRRPERYRLVYQLQGSVVRVWGFGPRHPHRLAAGQPALASVDSDSESK